MESPDAETIFQVVVGVLPLPPDDLPQGYSSPEQCRVPATPSLTRAQLKVKNDLWPTVFSPHLLPIEIQFARADVERIKSGMKIAVDEAVRARAMGEVCV
jgi:tRNA-specific adenosine deaminase 3